MKRVYLLILAAVLLIGAVAFGAVGVVHWINRAEQTEITDYGMMTFYVSSFGTASAYDDNGKSEESIPLRYVEYRTEDGRFSFLRELSEQEYFDFEFARETEAEHRSIQRYVYTYFDNNGDLQVITQEQNLSDNQLREIIGNTEHISTLQYLAFAVILLLGGGYLLATGMQRQKEKPEKKPAQESAEN